MISIVAKFIINEGKEKNFLALTEGLVEASRAEEGCIEYILYKDTKEPRTFCMIEKWENQEAIDIHNSTAHFTSAIPKIVELAQIDIDIYEPV